jgi:predicted histone-like DNA-binding protein
LQCQKDEEVHSEIDDTNGIINPLKITNTMAIKVKAVERNVSFDKTKEKWAYVLQADLYNKLSQNKVITEASLRSGITRGSINAAWDAIGEVIKAWATEGHAVAIPGLGSMRFGLRASSVADVNKVAASLITSRRVIFVPNVEIKDELARTSINITCYDRNGEVVKRVTSSDDGTVEDPEEENGSSTGSETGNGSNSGNSGSGSNSQSGTSVTLSAPSFSGDTQFEESTQVTMSGPDGAEIHYTLDGSTPTTESPVYSEPLTLTDTTTVKAIAIKDGQSSEVTSRTYTKGSNGGEEGDQN